MNVAARSTLCLVLAALAACSAEPAAGSFAGCTPGVMTSCDCAGGAPGQRACLPDRSPGECRCAALDAGGDAADVTAAVDAIDVAAGPDGGDAGPPDGDAPDAESKDGPSADAAPDAPQPDDAAPDAAPDATAPDAAPDATPDAPAPDAALDAPQPDAAPDAPQPDPPDAPQPDAPDAADAPSDTSPARVGLGAPCALGAECESNSCCGARCVDLAADRDHCGGCGRACATGQVCAGGSCACAPGRTLCRGACVDLQSDPANCGSCGRLCATGFVCAAGACVRELECGAWTPEPLPCAAMPLDFSTCGGPEVVMGTDRIMGSTTSGSSTWVQNYPFPTGFAAGDRLDFDYVVRTSSGSNLFRIGARNDREVVIINGPASPASPTMPYAGRFSVTGSGLECEHPSALSLYQITYPSLIWDVRTTWTRVPNYNTGGWTAAAARPLATDPTTGMVCAQVCGDSKLTCGASQQHYALTIPAHGAAYIDGSGTAKYISAAISPRLLDASGAALCTLANVVVSTTPGRFRARVVNNGAADRRVIIATGPTTYWWAWNFSVATRRLP